MYMYICFDDVFMSIFDILSNRFFLSTSLTLQSKTTDCIAPLCSQTLYDLCFGERKED